MLARLLHTQNDVVSLILRLTLGVVFIPHGLQKTLGWFGGYGFSDTMAFFTQSGIPAFLAFLAIVAESIGALGLVAGFLTRVAAFGIGMVMAVALATVHWGNGFFMNWSGAQPGEGFEYHLLAIGIAAAVAVRGGGRWSIDRALSRDVEAQAPGHDAATRTHVAAA